jgi:hypothetical protein
VQKWLPAFSGALLWIALSFANIHWVRWGLPMFASPLIVSAIGLTETYRKITVANTRLKPIYFIVCALIAANFISGATAVSFSFEVTDSRVSAAAYCKDYGITRQNTVFEGYTPLNPTGPRTIFSAFDAVGDNFVLKESRVDYVILSSNMFGRFYAEPVRYADQIKIYEALAADYELIDNPKPPIIKYSTIEAISIYYHAKYCFDAIGNGSGPELQFYKADNKNHASYQIGKSVIFAKDGCTANQYVIDGLGSADEKGTWSSGDTTQFRFYFNDESPENLRLNFTVTPLRSTNLPSQKVDVYAGNEKIAELDIKETGNFGIDLPNSAIADGKLDIIFKYANAASPHQLGINSDERILALFFSELSISS